MNSKKNSLNSTRFVLDQLKVWIACEQQNDKLKYERFEEGKSTC